MLALFLPVSILAFYMVTPAVKTSAGIAIFNIIDTSTIVDIENHKKTGRNLQKFFRKFDTAIDLDDIIFGDNIRLTQSASHPLVGCLSASHTLFVPIKFRLPYYGVKVYEWCLKLKK